MTSAGDTRLVRFLPGTSRERVARVLALERQGGNWVVAASAGAAVTADGEWVDEPTTETAGVFKVEGSLLVFHNVAESALATEADASWATPLVELPAGLHRRKALAVYHGEAVEASAVETESGDDMAALRRKIRELEAKQDHVRPRFDPPPRSQKKTKGLFDDTDEDDEEDGAGGPSWLQGARGLMNGAGGPASTSLFDRTGAPPARPLSAPGPAAAGSVDATTLVLKEIVEQLKDMRRPAEDEATEGLDGLRVVKTLGRLRALKHRFETQPERIVRDYVRHWEEELGAAGRPWTWRDASTKIAWGKYRSMQRVYLMLGAALAHAINGDTKRCAAQLVQNMKAVHEFAAKGRWEVAWPLTFQPDPLKPRTHGADEEELEAIMGYLRVQHDLETKVLKQPVENNLSEDEAPPTAAKAKGEGKGQKK